MCTTENLIIFYVFLFFLIVNVILNVHLRLYFLFFFLIKYSKYCYIKLFSQLLLMLLLVSFNTRCIKFAQCQHSYTHKFFFWSPTHNTYVLLMHEYNHINLHTSTHMCECVWTKKGLKKRSVIGCWYRVVFKVVTVVSVAVVSSVNFLLFFFYFPYVLSHQLWYLCRPFVSIILFVSLN